MQKGKVRVQVTPGLCICLAFSLFVLPLNWVVSWLLALTVHELCHYLAVLLSGGRVHHIRLTLSGAQITADALSRGKEACCALAGPIGGLLLLLFRRMIPITAFCGSIHAVYNLIPLQSLDGGKALLDLLSMLTGEKMAEAICNWVDRISRIALFLAALYIAWRLSWGALAIFAGVLYFGKWRKLKSPCKQDLLRVQ